MANVLASYMDYTRHTESPYIYHRWCALAAISALLGRSSYIRLGHQRIFPSIYCLLVGEPGTRKSTAIKTICRSLLSASGYDTFAADKTSKEKFLLDLAGVEEGNSAKGNGYAKSLDQSTLDNLWDGESYEGAEPKEVFICADEFSVFSSLGNGEFFTDLGNFWDWDNPYKPFKSRVKNSISVSIYQPTITILGGTTPTKFAKIFPADILEDGFLSRMILIRGENSGRKYPRPPAPEASSTAELAKLLQHLRGPEFRGCKEIIQTGAAAILLDSIYIEWKELDDLRFRSYSTRRYTQLLKLCIIVAASRFSPTITEDIVVEANTYLTGAELAMPKALGEFGKNRNSDVSNKIVEMLSNSNKAMSIQDIFKQVSTDVDKIQTLIEIMNSLRLAEKVQLLGGHGYLPLRKPARKYDWVDWSLLTPEERLGVGE